MNWVRSGFPQSPSFALGAAAVSVFLGSLAPHGARPTDPAHWSTQEWIAWRDGQISSILAPTVDARGDAVLDRLAVGRKCAAALAVVESALKVDSYCIRRDPERLAALSHFIQFVTAQSWESEANPDGRHPHALGLELSDREYWERIGPKLEFPSLLKSPEFLRLVSNPATYGDAVRQIESQNSGLPENRRWMVLAYRSQFILSADRTTRGRLLVVIPGEPASDGEIVDRWIQFAIATPGQPSADIRSVSMVAVYRRRDRCDPARIYMADFFRTRRPFLPIALEPTMFAHDNPSTNCYNCHKTGLAPIHPKVEYRFNAAGALVERSDLRDSARLNELISTYGNAQIPLIYASAYGPSIGDASDMPSDDFIRKSSVGGSLSATSVARIKAAMNCASCHDRASAINYPQAVRTIGDQNAFENKVGLVETYVENGWMPPDNRLSRAERVTLFRALLKSYYEPETATGALVRWLKVAAR